MAARKFSIIDRTAAAYALHLDAFLKRWARKTYRRPPLLRALLTHIPARARILDLGSGAGQDTRDLHAHRYRVIGLDRTWELLRYARCRSPRVPLLQGDMRALPFQPRSFHAVWAAASLMHLPKAASGSALQELHRSVVTGGMLAATVAQGRRSGVLTAGWIPGRYFARWKKDEWSRALRRAGWDVLELVAVSNRERKGRWLNVLARRRR